MVIRGCSFPRGLLAASRMGAGQVLKCREFTREGPCLELYFFVGWLNPRAHEQSSQKPLPTPARGEPCRRAPSLAVWGTLGWQRAAGGAARMGTGVGIPAAPGRQAELLCQALHVCYREINSLEQVQSLW